MRLTLRTLLAYLDDTLEPAQAKVIGQKVAESETARELIERIKQVTRRRRLAAPPASGPGSKLDVNAVAEYIDNVLPDDQIAEVEETFLNSDVHLAEVAACHQILTLFLGQPTQVPPTARQRMIGLVKGRESVVMRRPPRGAAVADDLGPASLPDEADEALLLGMPSYLRRHAWARRLAPVAAVLGLVALLLVAIWQIVPRGAGPVAGLGTRGASRADDLRAAGGPGPTAAGGPVATAPGKPPTTEPGKEDPKDVAKQPIHESTAPDKPSAERRDVGKYVATDVPAPSVLLRRPAAGKDKDAWQRVKADAAVATTDPLVSLAGYRSDVRLDSGVLLTLWGNLHEFTPLPVLESGATLHVPPAGFDLDCTLTQGMIVVANKKPAAKAKARVRFLDEVWDVTLDDGAAVALSLFAEYTGRIPFRSDGKGEGPLAMVNAFGLKGDVEIKTDQYQSFALPVAAWYQWDNTGSRQRSPRPLEADAIRWYTDDKVPDSAPIKAVVAALKDLGKRLGGDKPVGIALTETRKEATGATLALSIFSLAAVDDIRGMIDAVGDRDRPDVRWFAHQALRHWIAAQPENDMKLYRALQKNYTNHQAEDVMKLLHGFARDDWDKVDTYEWLIDKLDSKEVALRELAYYQLWSHARAEAAKTGYRPGDGEAERRPALDKWKKLLEEGKLPPKK